MAETLPSQQTEPWKPRARSTINDVAKAAGVSKATVSRYVNGGDRQLASETAARVALAIEQLDYQPSPLAQSLKHGRTRMVGLAVADVTNPYSVAVLQGAERACREAGYLAVLFDLGNEPERELSVMHALRTAQIDGLILNRVTASSSQLCEQAQAAGKPIVLIDRLQDGFDVDFVSVDNQAVVHLALDHLHEQGWRDFLLISEPVGEVSSRAERQQAFQQWVNAHQQGKAASTGLHLQISKERSLEATHLQQLLEWRDRAMSPGGHRAPAILTSNGVATLFTMGMLRALSWQPGSEVGFAAIDELDWASLIGPGLTTVAQPTDELGALAVQCLLERLSGCELAPRRIHLGGELRVRGSSVRGS